MEDLPRITSNTRMLSTASERARSVARLEMRDALTPAAGSNSKRVTTGPVLYPVGMHGNTKITEFFYQPLL